MFEGCFIAVVTPFDVDGNVDKKALFDLVEWQVSEGVDGIVCAGTTGEGTSLSELESCDVLEVTLDAVKGKVPVVMTTGTNCTRKSIWKTEKALKMGAQGALVIVPYYNHPTIRGCIEHYKAVSQVGLPIIVYHHPGRTGITLNSETLLEIAGFPNVKAIKDCSGNIKLVKEIGRHVPVLSGDDGCVFEQLMEGAAGTISVIGNILPKQWSEMIWKKDKNVFQKYEKLIDALMLEVNPQGIKYALNLMEKCEGTLRLPLVEVEEMTKNAIKGAMVDCSCLDEELV